MESTNRIKNIESTFYCTEIEPIILCEKVVGNILTGSTYHVPYKIEPTIGKHDYNNCEECQKQISNISSNLRSRFEGRAGVKPFPHCCSSHEKLLSLAEFDNRLFNDAPEQVANKIIYTKQHITNRHESQNWYKDITDYIEHVMESFGEVPIECGRPLYLNFYKDTLQNSIQHETDIPPEKKQRIISFIEMLYNPQAKPRTDFNILISYYEKWLKYFPFELKSYFGNLKEHFET